MKRKTITQEDGNFLQKRKRGLFILMSLEVIIFSGIMYLVCR